MTEDFETLYVAPPDGAFIAKYQARCLCGAVSYSVSADPIDAKICHWPVCQTLHGAPMQWAAIFHKRDVHFSTGLDRLSFYSRESGRRERIPPCKLSCAARGTQRQGSAGRRARGLA